MAIHSSTIARSTGRIPVFLLMLTARDVYKLAECLDIVWLAQPLGQICEAHIHVNSRLIHLS